MCASVPLTQTEAISKFNLCILPKKMEKQKTHILSGAWIRFDKWNSANFQALNDPFLIGLFIDRRHTFRWYLCGEICVILFVKQRLVIKLEEIYELDYEIPGNQSFVCEMKREIVMAKLYIQKMVLVIEYRA